MARKAKTTCTRDSKSNNVLSFSDSINWLKRRHQKTAQAHYLKTREEIQKEHEIEEVFQKIDYDGSGQIDVKELHYMFASNGV